MEFDLPNLETVGNNFMERLVYSINSSNLKSYLKDISLIISAPNLKTVGDNFLYC